MKNLFYFGSQTSDWLAIAAVAISILGMGISFAGFYFQYLKKVSKIIFNRLDFFDRNPFTHKIALSNPGNVEVLITGMDYKFVTNERNTDTVINIVDQTPNFPILIRPRDITAITITSSILLVRDEYMAIRTDTKDLHYEIRLIIHAILYDGIKRKADIPLIKLSVPRDVSSFKYRSSGFDVADGQNILSNKNSVIQEHH